MKVIVQFAVVKLCLFALLWGSCSARWHPYDRDSERKDCEQEIAANVKPAPASSWGGNYSLWHNLISQHDKVRGETMFGFTQDAFEKIWTNQHPKNCSEAKFLISGDWEEGFGSEIHVYGVGLAIAMNMNRVFILLPNRLDTFVHDKMHSRNAFQVNNTFCKDQKKENLECYYEPLTSCSILDALPDGSLQHLKEQRLDDINPQALLDRPDRPEKTLHVRYDSGGSSALPDIVRRVIECSPFIPKKRVYWWRSMAAAYFLRPSAPTRALIAQHRRDKELAFDQEKEHCVSVYVRRGDKGQEATVPQNDTQFFEAAKQLWSFIEGVQEGELPTMFFGSEDPSVLDNALAWGKANNWRVLYTNLFDRRAVTTGLNSTVQLAARQHNSEVHDQWEYLSLMVNLDSHLQCSAFVCTHNSNFCRVIDEMRATVAAKAHRPYVDLSCASGMHGLECPDIEIHCVAVWVQGYSLAVFFPSTVHGGQIRHSLLLHMEIADFFKNALANDDTLPPAQDPGLTAAKEPVEVRFLPANKTVKAYLGQNIGMIAKSARVEIRYKCREGDCGTCTIKFDGKKVKACVSSLPVVSKEKVFTVEVPAYGKALDPCPPFRPNA